MALNVKICNIVADNPYSISYKSGSNPYPEDDDATFVLFGTGFTATTLTITGLSVDTQYWIKLNDDVTDRYVIKNIYSYDGMLFPCYSPLCFDVVVECVAVTPTPTPSPTPTPLPGITLIVQNIIDSIVQIDDLISSGTTYIFTPPIQPDETSVYYNQSTWTGNTSFDIDLTTLSSTIGYRHYIKTYINTILQSEEYWDNTSSSGIISIRLGGEFTGVTIGDIIEVEISTSLVPTSTPTATPTNTPTPTVSPTPTPTQTPTPTPTPNSKKYVVDTAQFYTCTAGLIVGLTEPITHSVSLYCSGTLTNGSLIYSDSALITPFPDCFFQIGSKIYDAVSGEAILEGTIGHAC
jgi:hypothetical protein